MIKKEIYVKKFMHSQLHVPNGYKPLLGLRETEEAIKYIKDNFQERLAGELNLTRVSAPVAVSAGTGINDHLTGAETPVTFYIKSIESSAEIVQSLAKWKRMVLSQYDFSKDEGIYTDMNALRPDERLDNLHSIYVDQWDWEKIIGREDRNLDTLKKTVKKIYNILKDIEEELFTHYPQLPGPLLPPEIHFIHSQELLERYPDFSPREREDAICREKGAVFIVGIGAKLDNGIPHDERAADYDDWITPTSDGKRGLNGDILVYYEPLDTAFEISSMGIRVDQASLLKQLEIKDEIHKKELLFHKKLLEGMYPDTVGGGIGQSRLCMFFLKKAHIGEVQAAIWPDEMIDNCIKNNIVLL